MVRSGPAVYSRGRVNWEKKLEQNRSASTFEAPRDDASLSSAEIPQQSAFRMEQEYLDKVQGMACRSHVVTQHAKEQTTVHALSVMDNNAPVHTVLLVFYEQ